MLLLEYCTTATALRYSSTPSYGPRCEVAALPKQLLDADRCSASTRSQTSL
jgi:hypothetical protein